MLDAQQKKFVFEYLKSHSMEGSAIEAGYPRGEAMEISVNLLANEEVQEFLKQEEEKLFSAVNATKMTKERLIATMWFQYEKANKYGKTKEATDILEKISRWNGIEPDKIRVEPVQFVINNLDKEKI